MNLLGRDRREAGSTTAIFAFIAVAFMGQTLQTSWGFYNPTALIQLGITGIAILLGVVCSRLSDSQGRVLPVIRILAMLTVGLQFFQLATVQPARTLQGRVTDYLALLAVFAAFTVPVCSNSPRFKRWYTVGWFISFWLVSVWILRWTYPPPIDVFWWTHTALDALSQGQNPFSAWMPNIYGSEVIFADGTTKYGRPITDDGMWVQAGYPYPPLSLMLSGGGYLLGDMRLSNLALIVGGAVALLATGRRFAALSVVLLLSTPRIFFVLENAWTDAYSFGLVALTVALAAKSSRFTPWVFGLALVSKQYTVFLAPLGLLLIPTPWDRRKVAVFLGQTLLAGCLVTVPWIMWDPKAFIASTYVAGFALIPSSLSFLVPLADGGTPAYVDSLPFLMLIPAYLVVLIFSARGAAGFAMSSALVLWTFFSFSKAAFCNQHFLVLGCVVAALATVRIEDEPPPADQPPEAGLGK